MTELRRCDVLVDDPGPVFNWLSANIHDRVVREMAYETVLGWHIKIALEGQNAVDRFWARWADDDATRQAPARRTMLLRSIRERTHQSVVSGAVRPT
jgi:hypothetical protein